jgi:hypothetical protein
MDEQALAHLVARMKQEREKDKDFQLPILLDLDGLLCLIGNLQLALRHPGNRGEPASAARQIKDAIMCRLFEEGYIAHVEFARLGDDASHDFERKI